LSSFFDGYQGVDGKGMAQGMGSGWIEGHIAHHLSGMPNADLFDRLVKEVTHPLISEGFYSFAGKKIGVVIMGLKGLTNAEVVVDLCYDGFRYGDQPIFFELGLFDVQGCIIPSVMVKPKSEGLRDAHAASGKKKDGKVCGELNEKGSFLSFYSFAYSGKQLCGLLG
jgi:hypothetical protein